MKGAGGGKRGGRKPTSVEADDRPRGYEAMRMRRLWQDIDSAKRKAGLGPAPAPSPVPAWEVGMLVGRATALFNEAASWMSAQAPTALAVLASGAAWLRAVPLVGRLVELVPGVQAAPVAPPEVLRPEANGTAHSAHRADAVAETEKGWLH